MRRLKPILYVLLGMFLGFAARDVVRPVFARQALPTAQMEMPVVYAGEDVGFRVQSYGPTGPRGVIVVRIDDNWQIATALSPNPAN